MNDKLAALLPTIVLGICVIVTFVLAYLTYAPKLLTLLPHL